MLGGVFSALTPRAPLTRVMLRLMRQGRTMTNLKALRPMSSSSIHLRIRLIQFIGNKNNHHASRVNFSKSSTQSREQLHTRTLWLHTAHDIQHMHTWHAVHMHYIHAHIN